MKQADAVLLALGAKLRRDMDIAYSHFEKAQQFKRPLERKLKRAPKEWEKREAIRSAFGKTRAGKAAAVEWDALNVAGTAAHKTALAILCKQPQTVAGAAVYAQAAVYHECGGWAGFGFSIHDAPWWILKTLSKAGRVPLPKGMKQALIPR